MKLYVEITCETDNDGSQTLDYDFKASLDNKMEFPAQNRVKEFQMLNDLAMSIRARINEIKSDNN